MISDEHRKLAAAIYQKCHLTGDFVLRSGRRTKEYFDKYQLTADPAMLDRIAIKMRDLIPNDVEVLAGLEMGAIPVVTMLSHHSGLPASFVRKKAKEHGTARLAEGASVQGKRVLVVEDVVTSGGQVVMSCADLRVLGADITHALVIIDREEGAAEALRKDGIELLALFTRDDLSGGST
jgi:orotate phosphoribosyltransferase